MVQDKKVYCQDCKYCTKPNFYALEICNHQEEHVIVETNMRIYTESNTLARDRNKNNDCIGYVRTHWFTRAKRVVLKALF